MEKEGISDPVIHGDIEVTTDNDNAELNDDDNANTAFTHGTRKCRTKRLQYRYPMKFWVPYGYHTSPTCVWVYGIQFGGGFVGGDEIHCRIAVGSHCSCLYTSLGYGKAFTCEKNQQIKQHNEYIVNKNALLLVMPDPVMVYKDAVFMQKQKVILTDESSEVILVDWYTAGRAALQEHWSAKKVASDTTVFMDGKPVLREAFVLERCSIGSQLLPEAMGKHAVFGTCIVIGPCLSRALCEKLQELKKGYAYGVSPDRTNITACSPVYKDTQDTIQIGQIIRFCFYSSIKAYEFLGDFLEPAFKISGGNPFERHY